MAKKKEDVNLNDIDANFIISSFKNKERRNNPSSIPRPLLPPEKEEKAEPEKNIEPQPVGEAQEEQDSAMQPRESGRKKKGRLNYKETFVRRNEIKTRECVYISREIHSKIVKLVRALEDENPNITIGGYIDLVLSEHLEQHREEINEIFRQSRRDLL